MSLNTVDWVAVAVIVFSALAGMRRGLVVSALSLAGLMAGAYGGSRIAPHVLHGGSSSPWTPVASLAGAVFGAILLQTAAALLGSIARGTLRLTPLRFLDSAGGFVFGVVTGLVLVWVMGSVLLLAPGQTRWRRDVRASSIVRRLDDAVSPSRFLHLLARIDPYPSIAGPPPPARPTPRIAVNANVRTASRDVVRVLGDACGVGIEGSGWFVRRDLVVTAAHVVAGEHDTSVVIQGVRGSRGVSVVRFDPRNDIAVLRVLGASVPKPLQLVDPVEGASVAVVGYPGNGKLDASPGRIGATEPLLTQDAYGHGPVSRQITTLAGVVRHGDSGAPAIDAHGAVESTIFATSVGQPRPGGYGVPASVVRLDLAAVSGRPVPTGACAG